VSSYCAGCGEELPDTGSLEDGCPVCGSRRFYLKKHKDRESSTDGDEKVAGGREEQKVDLILTSGEKKPYSEENMLLDSPESIRILEPGRYDLNLSRLAESDDLVVKVGPDDTFRLDLHSMVRKNKK